ncbi:MAG: hypothetical protein AAF725_24760 [Acidobacteriota bacterium]
MAPQDIWDVYRQLGDGLEASEAEKLHGRVGALWGEKAVSAAERLFRREFDQSLEEARLGSVVEALGDVCERADLGRMALDFEDASHGLVHVWQYSCPGTGSEAFEKFIVQLLQGFHGVVMSRLAGRELRVRWLSTQRKPGILRFLAGTSQRLARWEWQLAGGAVVPTLSLCPAGGAA